MPPFHSDNVIQLNPTDRHHCFKSSNIPKTEGGQILPHLCNSDMISMKHNRRQKEALLEQKYYSGSMPLLTPNHSFRTCGGPKIFNKCGGNTSSVEQECYILKTHEELSYPAHNKSHLTIKV